MKKTVLIVDDDLKVLKAAKQALEKGDFKVVGAGNGLECLQKLHDGLKPRLVVLESSMPVMSGWRTLYEMHKDKNFAKIKTAFFKLKESKPALNPKHFPNSKEYSKALESHYIQKPFTPKELLKKVKELTAS